MHTPYIKCKSHLGNLGVVDMVSMKATFNQYFTQGYLKQSIEPSFP